MARIRVHARRARDRAQGWTGPQVVWGIVIEGVVVVLAALGALLGLLSFTQAAAAAVLVAIAYAVAWAGAFGLAFLQVSRHPDRHPDWCAAARAWTDNTLELELTQVGVVAQYIHGYRCSVTDPAGRAAVASEEFRDAAGHRFRFWFAYPRDFDGAAAVVPGDYAVRWELARKGAGRWEEISYLPSLRVEAPSDE
jgi:hypothetical protein